MPIQPMTTEGLNGAARLGLSSCTTLQRCVGRGDAASPGSAPPVRLDLIVSNHLRHAGPATGRRMNRLQAWSPNLALSPSAVRIPIRSTSRFDIVALSNLWTSRSQSLGHRKPQRHRHASCPRLQRTLSSCVSFFNDEAENANRRSSTNQSTISHRSCRGMIKATLTRTNHTGIWRNLAGVTGL